MLEIKKANRNDMRTIAEFIRSSASWYEPFLAEKDLKEHYVDESWMEKNYKKRDFYLGVNNEGKEVGTISMQYFEDYTYLGYIYLDSSEVGKGHGKELIDFAKLKSSKNGQKSMVLIAHPEAKWATKAYEKYGFKKKATNKDEILKFNNGFLGPYYEEGFHLYEYTLG